VSESQPAAGAPPVDGRAPLLRAEDLELLVAPDRPLTRAGTLEVAGKSLVCLGQARAVLAAATRPELVRSGALRFLGQAPAALLASGRAGYCPRALPAPPEFTVLAALLGSVRLIGLGASDVRRALDRCEAEGLAKRPLKELGPLEHHLVGLAHGIASNPELLLVEDPFDDVEDEQAELLFSIAEREVAERRWLFGTELRSPWARRLAQSAEHALTSEGGTLFGPIHPADLVSPGAWVRFDRVTDDLLGALASRGAEVVRTPSETVVLVRRMGGLGIADIAAGLGFCLLELTPLMPGD
jgi:hypothetical protein